MIPDLTPRLIVGMSGASGVAYGIRILELLRDTPIETHLVVSRAARLTLSQETDMSPAELESLADVVHPHQNVGATISSGSFRTMGMVVAPCSVKTMSEIASGNTSNLLSRAADVTLKERRRLVLMVRETPLHRNHLRTMTELSELGAVIAPPVPAFYTRPESLADMVDHTVGRVLDLFDVESGTSTRWDGLRAGPHRVDVPE
ncbi:MULTISPECIES: UbiX family flavin prenyltransferase [Pseudonocardia]|uniref:Flavin prenyltransferase UbiX n=2 Tax=Pseudonocardia TaxID=1847 RepID=A0A1Y2MPS9_PSEAH|nr:MULTISPECIES: UbiX family flavin prenyltransferase [Pseudonocardia]OSY37161.1 3-octaprenyl-4-hydroxybenzoate carboxy-lyase partner protein [Pseudonocardia autotrophica]TDN74782.1 4-hydroxy-3-polyprenylbenzoate decarboxylase [Pseudonocardia autotrophica]BBG05557.1 flavin prenyltransferase UbiX [Pseudonocardia autotrophica]GEC25808.1 flavin prenyltransferase UbiX [Pseudonocardia saturnea]